jgi:hypothetical protein
MFEREELEGALALGYEGRSLELKGSGSFGDRRFRALIARASLGMGNIRDGGYVVIGIDDTNPGALLPGLNPDELASWLVYDEVSAGLNTYADPPLGLDVREVALSSGVSVAVLRIAEFEVVPHLCARTYDDVLSEGALYVRSRRIPETAQVRTSAEMREILDLAVEKRLRAYVETAQRAGVGLVTTEEAIAAEAAADQAEFVTQAREAWDE